MNSRRTFLATGAAALLPLPAIAQTAGLIRVDGPPIDGVKALYYGIKSGLFKRYGLDVEATTSSSGSAATAAVIGGSEEVAFVNALTLFQAHNHDVPLVFVAPGTLVVGSTSATATLVMKDSAIHTGRDLNGKTLGSPALRDVNQIATLAWIDKTGGDSSTVRLIEVPNSSAEAMLEAGRADAVTLSEPARTRAMDSGKLRVLDFPYSAVANRIMTAGYAAMEPAIERNRDLWSRFARAMHESSGYCNSHLPDTAELVGSYSGMAPELINRSVRMIDGEYLQAADLQPLIDLSVKYKLIDKPFPATDVFSAIALKPAR